MNEASKKFKLYLDKDTNRENLRKMAIPIQKLPPDDDWITDDVWDEVYKETVLNKKQ